MAGILPLGTEHRWHAKAETPGVGCVAPTDTPPEAKCGERRGEEERAARAGGRCQAAVSCQLKPSILQDAGQTAARGEPAVVRGTKSDMEEKPDVRRPRQTDKVS